MRLQYHPVAVMVTAGAGMSIVNQVLTPVRGLTIW